MDVPVQASEEPRPPRPTPLMASFDLKGVAELISSGAVGRIVCMCGAGISVSAGIPDFRTPGNACWLVIIIV